MDELDHFRIRQRTAPAVDHSIGFDHGFYVGHGQQIVQAADDTRECLTPAPECELGSRLEKVSRHLMGLRVERWP
jgi:hypothetical protein